MAGATVTLASVVKTVNCLDKIGQRAIQETKNKTTIKIITINSIIGPTKPLFYQASVLKYKFDSRGEHTKKVNSLAKTTVNCLEKITEKIGQHAITKEKTLECIQIYSL